MEIKKTIQAKDQYVKLLVYGQAGAGKTYMVKEIAQACLLISTEGGLLSIAGTDIDHIEVENHEELLEIFQFLQTEEAMKRYKIIALDSISEIAEKVLSDEKLSVKDSRQAYGEMQDKMQILIRAYRDLPYHVYMTCKAERGVDENGSTIWLPSMPGQKLSQQIPYFFDEVLALRVGKNEDGDPVRWLQTQPDGVYTAKDRSGKLAPVEPASLRAIFSKILKNENIEKGEQK